MADPVSTPSPHQQEMAALRHQVANLEAALAAQQQMVQALRQTQDYATKIVETVRDPLIVLDTALRIQAANPAFYRTFQVTPAETLGHRIYDLGNGQWAIPALRALLEEILPEQTVFNDYEVTHEFMHLGRRTMLLNARRLDHLQLILLAIEDVTIRKATEALQHEYAVQLATEIQTQTAALQQAHTTLLQEVAARERAQETVMVHEKRAAIETLLAQVAHELNNPLAILTMELDLMQEELGPGPWTSHVAPLVQAVERCRSIMHGVVGLTR